MSTYDLVWPPLGRRLACRRIAMRTRRVTFSRVLALCKTLVTGAWYSWSRRVVEDLTAPVAPALVGVW